jgi:hypothetical protein
VDKEENEKREDEVRTRGVAYKTNKQTGNLLTSTCSSASKQHDACCVYAKKSNFLFYTLSPLC